MAMQTINHKSVLMQHSGNFVCTLCGGKHGNNSECQMNDWPQDDGADTLIHKSDFSTGRWIMEYSREAKEMAENLVNWYAKYCASTGQYILPIDSIPEHETGQFAVIIMGSVYAGASEATGPDNERFDDFMLPSLVKLLRDRSNPELQKDFIDEWTNGVTGYFRNDMEKLIGCALQDYNSDHGCTDNDFVFSNENSREEREWIYDRK